MEQKFKELIKEEFQRLNAENKQKDEKIISLEEQMKKVNRLRN